MLKTKLLWIATIGLFIVSVGCRYDMQDQPRYKAYKKSDFFNDKRASRDLPDGTVARGHLREDKIFYTGKKENADPNAQVQTTVSPTGNTLVTSFPNDIEKMPVPLTKELVERGQERYNVYCTVCHGPLGKSDGMVVRRGFPQPPTYHDDRLRNAPDGHFFDVMTNGWGRMSSYAQQISASDRWAIVAYIRALQLSQNPNGQKTMSSNTSANATNTATAPKTANANTTSNTNSQGGGK